MAPLKGERIFHEVVGLFLVALTIFLFLSLVSYSRSDPCLNMAHGGHGAAGYNVSNYAGPIGAVVSDILIRFLGVTAFFIPMITLFLGLHIMCMKPVSRKWGASTGAFFFLVTTPSLISLVYPKEDLNVFHLVLDASGWVGSSITTDFLIPNLGRFGVYLVLVTIWIASVMMMTRISIIGLVSSMGQCLEKGLYLIKVKGWLKRRGAALEIQPAPVQKATKAAKPKKEDFRVEHHEEEQKAHVEHNRHQLLPPFSILKKAEKSPQKKAEMEREILNNSRLLEAKLLDFGVEGRVAQVHPGPVITRYEFEPAPGIKINRIANLSDDIALAMKAQSVRIVAPVPGKSVVGLEIPNSKREIVVLRDVITSKEFRDMNSKLTLALGKDIAGKPYVTSLAKMPHLLVAGATGSGKSVSVNSIICSILFNATADEVKFLMIDPKRLELGIYNDIPHLLVPVVMEPKQAVNALRWATEEMDNRYRLLADKGVRNIDQYNAFAENGTLNSDGEQIEKLPYIVIVIDEFADLILISGREIEGLLTRLAQMARAVGLHLVIATQRPSVDIITGIIKANFPCRISFRVSSKTDSRTILDNNGAEKLLGMGDMLFLPPGASNLIRVHGSAVTEEEINAAVDFLRQQSPPDYDDSIIKDREEEKTLADEGSYDELYDKAVDLVVRTNKASISMVQRHLKIGYNRAARMIEIMERDGVVSKPEGSKPREVLVRREHEAI
ncbi:DNA translocase FtsK 4TM domain-containing protein [bacterium]|nr:DNA translocase FtsK 4TM domain-containing protein [bacterium]